MKPLLTALLIIINCACFAQKIDDSSYFQKLKTTIFKLEFIKTSFATIPFNQIQVVDARADTSSVGFFRYSSVENIKKIVFPKSLESEITDFAVTGYKSVSQDSSNNLFLIIKEYRISNYVKALTNVNLHTEKGKITPTEAWKTGIIVSAELFLRNKNTFHALYKVDTILVNDSSALLQGIIQKSFAVLFTKVSNKNLTDIHIGKTEFSYTDIQHHIESFSNYPILKDSVLKKGIYKNFTEFKLNNPSIINYTLNRGKLSDEVFINENDQSFPLQSFWGFCDGKNLFIRSVDNLFPLIRTNKTFNVRGTKSLAINNHTITNALLGAVSISTLGLPANGFNNSSYEIKRTTLQLNMQTGELY